MNPKALQTLFGKLVTATGMAPDKLLVLIEDPGAVEAITEAISAYQTAPQKGNKVEEALAQNFRGKPATLAKALLLHRATVAARTAKSARR